MENARSLPFKVGDLAEARSFQQGYRGAWFRCKIREIGKRAGYTAYLLEYYDFPDERLKWTKLYQFPQHYLGKGKAKTRELILRPCYPPIYNEKQVPGVPDVVNSEVAVIVDNSWKVGDLVDWWSTGCYWSGTITELLDDNKAMLELKQPPHGEGLGYEILLKDLRPSLDWSLESGWTLLTQDNDPDHLCARLIKPTNHAGTGGLQTADACNENLETEADHAGLSYSSRVSSNSLVVSDDGKSMETMDAQRQSPGATVSKEMDDVQGENVRFGEKTSSADADSGQAPAPVPAEVAEEELKSNNSPMKHEVTKAITLHSLHPDTLEAAIVELQQCANNIRRLKKKLNGVSSSDTSSMQWKFVEPRTSS